MPSFLNGDPIVATEQHINAPWSGNKKNFRCGFCGHKFKVGDTFRGLYTNDMKGAYGNPLVCNDCWEGREVSREKWKILWENWRLIKVRYWWFVRDETIR